MSINKNIQNNQEPIIISKWYAADVENALERAGIEINEQNMSAAITEVKKYYKDALHPAGNEILEIMMSNLFNG